MVTLDRIEHLGDLVCHRRAAANHEVKAGAERDQQSAQEAQRTRRRRVGFEQQKGCEPQQCTGDGAPQTQAPNESQLCDQSHVDRFPGAAGSEPR